MFRSKLTLEETVRSVLSQELADIEVLIVDDGSTDGTRELADSLAARDPRIRVVRQRNAGVSSARNLGARASRAPFLCFLDHDDLLSPDQLLLQHEALRASPEAALAYSRCWMFDHGDRDSARPLPIIEDPQEAVAALRDRCEPAWFCTHAALIRRSAFEAVGGFRSFRRFAEDRDLFVRIACHFPRFLHVPCTPSLYRRLPGSMSYGLGHWLEVTLPTLRWLWRHGPGDAGTRRSFRIRARYRCLALACEAARTGEGSVRRALLQSLRFTRRPGELMETLRLLLRPSRAARLIPPADGGSTR